jgi:hypothetical protein
MSPRTDHGGDINPPTTMNKHHTLHPLLPALAAALLLAVVARAGGLDQPAPTFVGQGLLGQAYGTLTYSYTDLGGTTAHGDNYLLELTQPLAFGLDGVLGYEFAQTGVVAGTRDRQQTINAVLRAFSTSQNWGKPYVEAGGGYAWGRFAGTKDNSFVWQVAAGAEFQAAPALTVTPYVRYVDAPDLPGGGVWHFGVKGNYWVDAQWAVTAGFERTDDHDSRFTVGTNFRF